MNEEKKKKLAQVDELVKSLGLTREEVVDFFNKLPPVKETKKSRLAIDIKQVEVGMIWYEDDTFSFDRITGKKIKAIVELIEDDIIYGDLTASELFEIEEQDLTWHEAMRYIENFRYPCQKNEKIVLYSLKQFVNLSATYEHVRRTFDQIHKQCRGCWYWSSTERSSTHAFCFGFSVGHGDTRGKAYTNYVRPVLALKVF